MATVSPTISCWNGEPLLTRTRAVVISAGQAPTIALPMLDRSGAAIDLTASQALPATPAGPVVQLNVAEAIGGPSTGMFSFSGTIADPLAGTVFVSIPPRTLVAPGVYDAAFAVFQADGTPLVVNEIYLVLERNLFSGDAAGNGPPRVDQVRMQIRDSSPVENRLLDGFTLFDDAEVAMALIKTVRAWNEELPDIARFTTVNFPREFQLAWIEGACAQLLYSAAEWYRKNYLVVQGAAGTAVADMDKAEAMFQSAERRWQTYLQWARSQKSAMNMARAYGGIGSPYRFIGFGTALNP